jgi:hypothetical protein
MALGAGAHGGVLGTLLTAVGGGGPRARCCSGLSWTLSLLLGTALAPTDPAVVFSVLWQPRGRGPGRGHPGRRVGRQRPGRDRAAPRPPGRRRRTGRGERSARSRLTFVLQMGRRRGRRRRGGLLLLTAMRRIALPGEGRYPLRTLAGALTIYGLATVAHGSGFWPCSIAGSCWRRGRPVQSGRSKASTPRLGRAVGMVAFVRAGADRVVARRRSTERGVVCSAWCSRLLLAFRWCGHCWSGRCCLLTSADDGRVGWFVAVGRAEGERCRSCSATFHPRGRPRPWGNGFAYSRDLRGRALLRGGGRAGLVPVGRGAVPCSPIRMREVEPRPVGDRAAGCGSPPDGARRIVVAAGSPPDGQRPPTCAKLHAEQERLGGISWCATAGRWSVGPDTRSCRGGAGRRSCC